ncbi:MAG: hypothetical protein JSW50_05320, partial [Candidatus Latescibacterota bacterium]
MRQVVLLIILVLMLDFAQAAYPPPVWSSPADGARFEFELEAGPVWQSRNDVQIPNTEMGTRFS